MPFINLIQEEMIAQKRADAKQRMAFMGFMCTLSLGIVGVGSMLFVGETLDAEVSRLNSLKQKQQPYMSQLEDNAKALKDMGPKLETLENAQEDTKRWNDILDHLSTQTPAEVTLNSLRCVMSDPSKPIELTVMGYSPRLELIGEFILRLQGSERLENVNLKVAQERMQGLNRFIEFDVKSDLAGTATKKKVDNEKEAQK